MTTGKLVVGLLALGAGYVALQSKRSDMAVDANKAPTVGNDPQKLGDGGKAPPIAVGDSVSTMTEQLKTVTGHANTQIDASTGGYGDTGAVGGDTSTTPTSSDHLAGMGVQPVKPNPDAPDGTTSTEPGAPAAPCTNPELCQAGTSATGDAPARAPTPGEVYLGANYLTFAVYGEGQTVTPKEESAAMETYGPSGGYVW